MASLDLPLLVFSGDFQAGVSTVNNDVRHYDLETFEPRFQEKQLPNDPVMNGWWNPGGGSNFDLVRCEVRRVYRADGTWTDRAAEDPVIGRAVAGPEGRSSGKLIDLDPQWQTSSELWGLRLRIFDRDGASLLEGKLRDTSFRDLNQRQQTAPNGQPLGANWTSLLDELQWGPSAAESPILRTFHERSQGQLFLRLTVFGYHYAHLNGRFAMGRLLGVIGLREPAEPVTALVRRRIASMTFPGFGPIDFGIEQAGSRAVLDLGNAVPLADPLGGALDIGGIHLAILPNDEFRAGQTLFSPGQLALLGEIPYRESDWLMRSSGIFVQPLAAAQLASVRRRPLALVTMLSCGAWLIRARENERGLVASDDAQVLRIEGGGQAKVEFHCRRFGQPFAGATISCELAQPDNESGGGSGSDPAPPQAPIPWTGLPREAVRFPATVVTDANGKAELVIDTSNPGNPRGYVEGQIYAIAYTVAAGGQPQPAGDSGGSQINIHLREDVPIPDRPEWNRDVRPILLQYGNLYPLMSRNIVDLGDYDDVVRHRRIILFAFTRDFDDPAFMPASRDLSKARTAIIVKWLGEEIPYRADPPAPAPPPLHATAAALPALTRAPLRAPLAAEMTGPRRAPQMRNFPMEASED